MVPFGVWNQMKKGFQKGLAHQYTHRIPTSPVRLLAHCSKQVLCTLFPQAALHQTISSVSGSNSVKQTGQSPEISLRLEELDEDVAEPVAEGMGGARVKIKRSSCGF